MFAGLGRRIWLRSVVLRLQLSGFVLLSMSLPLDALAAQAMENARLSAAPLVIAHRGASGLRPEHTLVAYELAIEQGADFIEVDVVATKDGVLIARHENALAMVALDADGRIQRGEDGQVEVTEATTNVAELAAYEKRLAVKRIDGRLIGGWFTEDFTLAEIRELRARERIPGLRAESRRFDDRFAIPTLLEIIELLQRHTASDGRKVGLYVEIKHPTYFTCEGRRLDGELVHVDLGQRLIDTLEATGFIDPERVFIQSFEIVGLMEIAAQLRQREWQIPLVQLFGDVTNRRYRAQPYDVVYHAGLGARMNETYGEFASSVAGGLDSNTSYAELATAEVLGQMAHSYAAAIGPPKDNLMPVEEAAHRLDPDGDGRATQAARLTGAASPLLALAHTAGLAVHPYTLRAEEPFLVRDGDRVLSVEDEARRLLELGVQGFFIDQPAAGRSAVDKFLESNSGKDNAQSASSDP